MAIDPKKLGALVAKHSNKKPPMKKPFGGGQPAPKHAAPEEDAPDDNGDDENDDAGGDNDDQIAEQQASRIANGNGDAELEQLTGDINTGDDGLAVAPDWAIDADVWERAEKAVSSLDVPEDQQASVLVHTYQALGGVVTGYGDGGDEGGDDDNDMNEEAE